MNIDLTKIKKILLARSDLIGDVTLATIILPGLRAAFPNAEITFMLRPLTRDLLAASPYINHLAIDKIYSKEIKTERDLSRWAAEIASQKYDLFISLWENPIYRKLAKLAKIKHFWVAPLPGKDLTKHQVYYNLEALNWLGTPTAPSWELYVSLSTQSKEKAEKLLKEKNIPAGAKLVSISPASSGRTKNWPKENYAKVAAYLINKHQAFVLVQGSSQEKEIAKWLGEQLGQKLIDCTGIPVGEMAALIGKSNLYIGGDTGTTHLAGALKVPAIAIYCEKRISPMRWAPWGTRHIIMYKVSSCPLKCRSLECIQNTCIYEITPEEVINAAEELLHGGGVTGLKESSWYWKQKAFRVLILSDRKDKKAEKLVSLLNSNGFYAWHETNPWQIRKINAEMIRTNTNIIHYLGRKKWLAKFLQILASNYVPHLPLLTYAQQDFGSIQELIALYTEGFKNL